MAQRVGNRVTVSFFADLYIKSQNGAKGQGRKLTGGSLPRVTPSYCKKKKKKEPHCTAALVTSEMYSEIGKQQGYSTVAPHDILLTLARPLNKICVYMPHTHVEPLQKKASDVTPRPTVPRCDSPNTSRRFTLGARDVCLRSAKTLTCSASA